VSLRILIVDDQPESVEPLREELIEKLSAECLIVNFDQAQAKVDEYRPAAVFLDLLLQDDPGGQRTVAAHEIYSYIWTSRFCPLVIYSAEPDALDAAPHPFVQKVQKGSGSEEAAVKTLESLLPQIVALANVEKDIDRVLHSVLKDLAPKIYSPEAPPDVLLRAARRQIAARMDVARGEDTALAPWELYIYPPVVPHTCMGDLLHISGREMTEPQSYRLVLTPSCDLVCSGGRSPRVDEVLVARCGPPSDLITSMGLASAAPTKVREKLIPVLSRGFYEDKVPLPAFPTLVPEMCANLRQLELVRFSDIGEQDSGTRLTRVLSVDSPFRELITWAFLQIAARPGLPDRDWTAWAQAISPDPTSNEGN
jgi:DNA-binding NarL/FixJ family response regulator